MIFAAQFGGDALDYIIYLFLTLVAVCISLVLHEVAHGLVAKWNGDYTAKYAGRLTLNPLKHFDPIGFLMMMLIGFGYAKPVPVNPYNFKHRTRGQVLVSIAGITVNMILAFISSLLFVVLWWATFRVSSSAAFNVCFYTARFFSIMTSLNLSLFFFNILPIFPLDGFRLVEALTHQGNKFCAFMRTNGQYILYGLVGLSFVVSMAQSYVPTLPSWFSFIDVLGTYLKYTGGMLGGAFTSLWWLMF